jgi:hypothetical protein
MQQADLRKCTGCGKLTPPDKLVFTAPGEQRCADCSPSYGAILATTARAGKVRRCHACGTPHTPEMVRAKGWLPIAFQKRYDCRCGHRFTLLTWPSVLVAAIAGAVLAWTAGQYLGEGEIEDALGAGVAMGFVIAILGYDARHRYRNPRVR